MNWISFDHLFSLIEIGLLLLSGYIILKFNESFQASMASAPQLKPLPQIPQDLPTIAVIIPAYNEAINIRDCVESVLQSELPNPQKLQIWISDDESTDETKAIAQDLVAQNPRVHLIAVPPRPTQEIWMGKNWACTQAAAQAQGEYLLFIDADVRLEKGAITAALVEAQTHSSDLLSCIPQILFTCLPERMAQPMMMRILIAGFNIGMVNDPTQPDTAFASGAFMLFRRQSYEQMGGHRALADNLVEDVGLARHTKAMGLNFRLVLGLNLVKVRMYSTLSALWEGWTKNLHLGTQRSFTGTLMIALIAISVLTIPWINLAISGLAVLNAKNLDDIWPFIPFIGSLLLLTTQAILWRQQKSALEHYGQDWLLSGFGGLLVAAMAIASIIKTETGWGWTWRGRSLAKPNHAKTAQTP
jgi:cellulose synthase/poly-beta-1,6-N-acetylglucosamine synthase-like glycosyltransferase